MKDERLMMSEGDGLAKMRGINYAVGIDAMAVAEGSLHTPLVLMAFYRTPAALALDNVRGDSPGRMGADHDEVGAIALADKATTLDAKEAGGIVAHQVYQPLQLQYTLVDQFEHRHQRELNHRHTTGSLCTSALFLRQQMGGVVSCHDGNPPVVQGLT